LIAKPPYHLPLVTFSQVKIIIKGLCRRHERWNAVHPASGAFWGYGNRQWLWPSFGAEAIGYMATNIDFRHKSNNLSFVEKSNYYYNFFY